MNNLLRLLQLSDPALPIGGFAHSAGLETYVQLGLVHDKKSAREFIEGQLRYNIHFTDAAFVSLAFDAIARNNFETIKQLDEECTALKVPKEMRLASQKLGWRLMKVFSDLCSHEVCAAYRQAVKNKILVGHYAIAFGLYGYTLGIEKKALLTGFYYNAAVGMVTNSVKLIPLGQQDGQEILFSLHKLLDELALASINPDKDKLGLCFPGFDIRCMQHEQLYSRLYMS